MSFSFAIIGGGWYGCHISASMRGLGFDVTLFEASHRLLDKASGNNQFRLHLGFHYPRHYATRKQSREGFSRFLERYPTLCRPVAENLYAVPLDESLLDFLTYKLIMTASGIEFLELAKAPSLLHNIEGCLAVPEQVLLIDKARRHFTVRLGAAVHLNHPVTSIQDTQSGVLVDGQRFDFVIDATWGHFRPLPIPLFFEPTMLLYYEGPADHPAVTLIDGPLASLYPTEDPNLFTLSSVPHTPLGRYPTAPEARARLGEVDTALIEAKRAAMEAQFSRFVPTFRDNFRFVGPQLAIKTKPIGKFDDRSCHVFREGHVFSVMSGKIDTIFHAVERILALIEAIPEEDQDDPGGLRAELLGTARTGTHA